jgi:hypothetical protein
VLLVAVGAISTKGIGGAWASCAAPPSDEVAVNQSDIVVVGTVLTTRSQNRIATVSTEEVWKGDVAKTLEVFGGPADTNAATSVDRTFVVGRRYLFFVREPAAHGYQATFGGRYEDSICSSTKAWTTDLARLRPASARSLSSPATTVVPHGNPARRPAHSTRLWPWLLGVGAVAIGLVGMVGWQRSRKE